ncbi:MAG: siphovirus ReqiPepy6 Gp37-like family protein [Clostridiaceae bacterium]|nr:siphovirus ReqiPepy6 Gp37-like family protein [Eubacteriales bacterium]
MELYVFGEDRSLLGVIEAYEHLQWTRRYSACGGFALRAIADAHNIGMLRMGHILWKNDDAEAGIIDHIELNAQEQEYITVAGRFATGLLARRIIWQTEMLQGNLANAIAQLLANHVIAPSNPDRAILGMAFASTPLNHTLTMQVSYRNLLTTIEDLCAAYDVGLRTTFDPVTRLLTVTLYDGRLTSAVFSREFENLTEQAYTHSARGYACVALIGGEGEGELRTMVTSGTGSGLGRYEVFVDAKALRSEDFGEGYPAALIQHGDIRLKELRMARSFDATLHNQGNLRYREDFDLGDIVTAVSPRWGVSMQTRITEIEETYDAEGRHIDIVLGRGALTIAQKLKGV